LDERDAINDIFLHGRKQSLSRQTYLQAFLNDRAVSAAGRQPTSNIALINPLNRVGDDVGRFVHAFEEVHREVPQCF
jgi:hypothetical protein